MNTVSDLISVIVPVYNRQDVIEECVNSILAQTYQNFEIIIVDDGSTDGTYNVCQSIANKDTRIKLFSADHGGVSAARNTAIENSIGEYVFFLDSDDVIYPSLFKAFIDGIRESDAGIAATGVVTVSEKNWHKVRERISESPVSGETEYRSFEESLGAIFTAATPLSCIGGVMMRRELIGDTKFRTDLFIGEDYCFIYDNLIKGTNCIFLKQKWYYVRNHKTNSSWNYSFEGFKTRLAVREFVWKSEEAAGRLKYANIKKRDAFGRFYECFIHNKPYNDDCKKMRKVMREYKKTIYPALTFKGKLAYTFCTHLPATAHLFLSIGRKISRPLKSRKKRG